MSKDPGRWRRSRLRPLYLFLVATVVLLVAAPAASSSEAVFPHFGWFLGTATRGHDPKVAVKVSPNDWLGYEINVFHWDWDHREPVHVDAYNDGTGGFHDCGSEEFGPPGFGFRTNMCVRGHFTSPHEAHGVVHTFKSHREDPDNHFALSQAEWKAHWVGPDACQRCIPGL
jgi:hypothetical protein